MSYESSAPSLPHSSGPAIARKAHTGSTSGPGSERAASPFDGHHAPIDTATSNHTQAGADHDLELQHLDSRRPSGDNQDQYEAPLLDNSTSKRRRITFGRRMSMSGREDNEHQSLQIHRLFMFLTVMAAVMVAINVTQASQIDRLHKFWWITGVPLGILVFSLASMAIYAVLQCTELTSEIKKAKSSEKVAWVGVVLTVLAPLIVCQFYYMPRYTVPAWHNVQWTPGLDVNSSTLFPAVLVYVSEETTINMTHADCGTDNNSTACNTYLSPFSTLPGQPGVQYFTFNPVQTGNVALQATASDVSTASVHLSILYDWRPTERDGGETFSIALYDPNLTFDISDYINKCGSPPFYQPYTPSIVMSLTVLSISAETFCLSDDIGALRNEPLVGHFGNCSSAANTAKSYTYYTARYSEDTQGDNLSAVQGCDISGTEANGNCSLRIDLSLATSLVTTQTSSHGTSTWKILTDEGGIVGGILFITWFFGIFVL